MSTFERPKPSSSFILQADLKLLAEQVTGGRSSRGVEERLELLQMEVAEQGREIQKLRRANEGLNELKEGMKECTLLLQGFRQQTTGVVAKQQQSTTTGRGI